ncbi:MAG: hypothetical protein AAGN15_15625 [Cyanobacteria bacterium J06581_3]
MGSQARLRLLYYPHYHLLVTTTIQRYFPRQSMENHTEPSSQQTAETEHLNKIRSILFGEQIQRQEQRFNQLETHINQTFESMNTQFTQQIERLERQLTQQLHELSQRLDRQLTQEADTRKDAIETVEQAMRNTIEHQIESTKNRLEHQIEQANAVMSDQIEQQKSTDEAEKSQLSDLFGEISKQLGKASQ